MFWMLSQIHNISYSNYQRSMNFISKIQNNYEQLWKYIIRPTRSVYSENDLGPPVLKINGKEVRRKDFMLTN